MPSSKHPQEAEIVHSLESTSLRPIDCVGRQWCGCESGGAGVGDSVGGGETAKPITDPIGVASPHYHADAALDDGGESWEEVAGVVSSGGEFVVWCVGALGVRGFGTDRTGDRWLQ